MLLFGYGYVYLFIPETKGLSLEEVRNNPDVSIFLFILFQVDEMYRSGVKPWNSAKWTPHLTDALHHEKPAQVRDSDEKQESSV